MKKQLSQLVALVTYANVSIQGGELDFDLEYSTTQHCYRLEFIERPPEEMAGATSVIASDATKWFAYLKEQGAK